MQSLYSFVLLHKNYISLFLFHQNYFDCIFPYILFGRVFSFEFLLLNYISASMDGKMQLCYGAVWGQSTCNNTLGPIMMLCMFVCADFMSIFFVFCHAPITCPAPYIAESSPSIVPPMWGRKSETWTLSSNQRVT